MVGPVTAGAVATRGNPRYTVTAPGAPRAGAPASSTDLTPGTTYLDQQTYLNAKADPVQLKRFIKDWVELGGRGIIGGDGKPASYWDVYQDLSASGIDVSDLTAPDKLPQGQTKGGGATTGLANPPAAAPAAAPTAPQHSQELTDLLKTLGVDYANAPAPTPALLAYLRGIGMTLSTAADTRNTAVATLGQRATDFTSQANQMADRTKTNLTADLVRRGVLRSGEATGRYARGQEDLTTKLSDITRAKTEGTQAADTGYANTQAAIRTAALDKIIAAEQEQATTAGASAAQATATKAAQDAADLADQRARAAQKAYQDWYENQVKTGAPAV